jgi:hypothetical protein
MRKLISGINLTLDGCCDHTKGNGNDEVHEYFVQQMLDVGQKPLHHSISIISTAVGFGHGNLLAPLRQNGYLRK